MRVYWTEYFRRLERILYIGGFGGSLGDFNETQQKKT